MERTNQAWIREIAAEEPPAIEDLRRYLKRGALAYLRGRSDLRYLAEAELDQMSEDFVQEALLKIRANLDTFQQRSKFTTWAAKITSNHIISELRRAKWRDLSLDAITEAGASLQEVLAADESVAANPDTASERRQVWETVMEVLENELTERQRQALASVHMEQIPISEVARLLDTNANNIYKLVHDARLKLKRRLRALGLEPEYILHLFSADA